ncbi:TetR/AcrR family transcriptional regulator [Streptomyces liangshanensis]|uniref:TetR/AcrR family transcriptional regulator n=1 Tax=Streptomyces liangshanensis TaxID=2717324 RepID=A0A6G9GTJ9_9ACTN|nr:TetR/AcrR family transcriptional regulator [Streptomyces liangshanensis]QIQ01267.1 TetR/AcrR family transcriptional regulator [Streptomyces liangshanensis]
MQEQVRRRRSRRGEGGRLREEILEAAQRILAEGTDPGDLSLRAVARAVGVATTSIYPHFSSLGELIHTVRKRFFADFGAVLDRAAASVQGTAADVVLARARAYVAYGLAHGGQYRTMFSAAEVPDYQSYDTEMAGLSVYRVVRDDVAAALDGTVDADLAATQLWTSLHGIVTLRAVRPDFPWPDLNDQIDDLVHRLLS